MNMKQTNEIQHAEVMTSDDVRIFFKIESIKTYLSAYGNDTKWHGSLWKNGKMIASYFTVSTCEMSWDSENEAEYYAEYNDELEEYEMDPDAYCAKHDSEIAKWVIQSCLECYRDTLYEEGYTEEYGIALEDFCLLHQIGEVGSFNHQEVPDFDCLQDFISYFRHVILLYFGMQLFPSPVMTLMSETSGVTMIGALTRKRMNHILNTFLVKSTAK